MKRRKIVFVAGLAVIAFVARHPLYQEFSEIHPSDPMRATALARCGMDDKFFSVLSGEARAACYDKWLAGDPTSGATLRVPNQIDLERDAANVAASSMVPDDIRNRQAADDYHPR